MPKWTAEFAEDGSFTIEPDTPETRADLERTLHDFHSGNLQFAKPTRDLPVHKLSPG